MYTLHFMSLLRASQCVPVVTGVKTICLNKLGKANPRPTQPSIPPGSVKKYQLWLGRQRQVWFIPLADERGLCRTVRSLENACHT